MLAQKVVDGVFESIKPYVNLRRVVTFFLIILLASDSGMALLFVDYSDVSLRSGSVKILEAIYESRFLIAFPSLWICLLISPNLSCWLARKTVAINKKLKFIDDFFKKAEGGVFLSFEVLEERKEKFVSLAKRYNALLETLLSVYMCGSVALAIDFPFYFAIGFVPFSLLLFLIYMEATSYVVRRYSESVYLLRLKSKKSDGVA